MFASKGKVLELKRKCIGGSDYSRICRSRLENFPTTINKLSGRAYKQESNQGPPCEISDVRGPRLKFY